MLQELHLRGLGVIAEASVEFAPGLNVVTGETGVGKTLLVTSLALLMGGRAHARLVAGTEAVVQAVVTPPEHLRSRLAEAGMATEDELILVRKIGADGRSRAFVGGQLVPISTLAEVGELLFEMHGQGAGFALARPAAQLDAIDALARNGDTLVRYREALTRQRTLERERAELERSDAERAREIDLLTYQADEIDRAALSVDEDDRLDAAIARLQHAERLGEIGAEVAGLVGAEGAAGELAEAHKALQSAELLDSAVAALVARLGDVAAEVSELGRDIRSWGDAIQADPSQLEMLRERKALLASLRRKYGSSAADILSFATDARERLGLLSGADGRIAEIDSELGDVRAVVDGLAKELTKRRKRACRDLTKMVRGELGALALPNAMFDVDHSEGELGANGRDRVMFGFSSSSARPVDDIGKVASGGELSRAMIAVTLALAQAHAVPVLVFDEADQGVGGEAALELGRRLARLGRSHQVLVVSHLAQIAAFADRHIAVRRTDDDVQVAVLDPEERLAETSRMLAGLESSDLARAHAAELLELAEAERRDTAGIAAAG